MKLVGGGLAGSILIPASISWQEIMAWSAATGTEITPWEALALRAMDSAWIEAYHGKDNGMVSARDQQGIGEYCWNENLEKCRGMFGNGLANVCRTCPN